MIEAHKSGTIAYYYSYSYNANVILLKNSRMSGEVAEYMLTNFYSKTNTLLLNIRNTNK